MTTTVHVGFGHINESFEVVFEVQELRDDIWVTTSHFTAPSKSFGSETIWVNKRIVISEFKKTES